MVTEVRIYVEGEYHKIHHAAELLKIIDPVKVQKASRHFDRLISKLME